MKILICGKGGSGKSTIASILAKNLLQKGYRVLVVDTDESNYGLNNQLGLESPTSLMDQMGGKKTLLSKILTAYYDGKKTPVINQNWTIDQIPVECISKKDDLYLMQIGKLQHFGEGCACPMGGLSKDFVTHLKLEPKDVAIIDTEAGTEHLARGVATGVDVVLMVLDPSYESIKLSKKTAAMVGEANKPVYFILNKINDQLAAAMIQQLGEQKVIAQIPFSSEIQEKGLSGEEMDVTASGLDDVTNFVIQTSQRSQN